MADDQELTESGRPRVPRPMPDTSSATNCPHCGAEVGGGHYVCWNCSKDIRMKEQTEAQILGEYQDMLVKAELRLERKNQRFFTGVAVLCIVFAGVGVVLPFRIGIIVLFLLGAALMGWFFAKSRRRVARIRDANAR